MTQPLLTGDMAVADPFAALPAWQLTHFQPAEIDGFNAALYNHFAQGRLFVASIIECKINVDALLAEYGEKIQRGAQLDIRKKGRSWRTDHRQFLLELETDLFVFINTNISCLRVFARDPKLAETTARSLAEKFLARHRKKIESPRYHLISIGGNLIDTTAVEMPDCARRTDEQLRAIYGDGFIAWEESLLKSLKAKSTGTVILRGPPGTGKTSYIRHLFSRLHRTHRFYFLPTTSFELLASPSLVEFWHQEAQKYPRQQKIVVLEDAEALLVDRSVSNRGAIANLLNLSDGLLGDFLRVQLLTSVNCDLTQLDPAIVRSGRLLAVWEFKRLPPEQAQRVAALHRLTLSPQADYSLAEIFNGSPKATSAPPRRRLGFGAHFGADRATDK